MHLSPRHFALFYLDAIFSTSRLHLTSLVFTEMVLCRAPLSLFIAPPEGNSRRNSKRGRIVCLSDGGFEASQSQKKSQLVVSITGATGFIGRRLVQKLIADDHIVRILTRSRRNAQLVFPGKKVCREWEAKALEVDKDVRLLLIRIGVVLGRDGGALAKMIPLFMMFAGGPLGSGKQWFSWIHLDDLVSLIYEALRNPSYKGIINGTAPNPVRLSEMCDQLGQVTGRPSWLPVPDLVLKGVLGEGASIVLEGQKVLPVKAKELGFTYKYPFVKDALRAIISSGST